ncbi:hypothetical protein HJ590_16565 [Naumannella sp. ID2617S]|nr:hypothetical protein [Naumannella sp. ID2617S]
MGHHQERQARLDYLTSYTRTLTSAEPCADLRIPANLCANADTLPIPVDPGLSPVSQEPGVFTMFGGDLTGAGPYTYSWGTSPNSSGKYVGDTSTEILVLFTATSSDAVLAWGGHIASRKDWGNGNSAVSISGSPTTCAWSVGGTP